MCGYEAHCAAHISTPRHWRPCCHCPAANKQAIRTISRAAAVELHNQELPAGFHTCIPRRVLWPLQQTLDNTVSETGGGARLWQDAARRLRSSIFVYVLPAPRHTAAVRSTALSGACDVHPTVCVRYRCAGAAKPQICLRAARTCPAPVLHRRIGSGATPLSYSTLATGAAGALQIWTSTLALNAPAPLLARQVPVAQPKACTGQYWIRVSGSAKACRCSFET